MSKRSSSAADVDVGEDVNLNVVEAKDNDGTTTTTETEADDDIEFLFHQAELEEEEAQQRIVTVASGSDLVAQEMVWQYADKPLLWVGSKGATHTHGNNLRQLLEDYIVVKVKANTKKFGGTCFNNNEKTKTI